MQQLKTQLLLPKEIITICRVRENELADLIREKLATELFREKLVSLGKAAEIAGVTNEEMMRVLASKRIPLHYTAKDLEDELKPAK